MIFSSRLSLSNVIELCRVLRHYLGAGLTLRDVFRQQATRGPRGVRPVAGRIAAQLEQGGALEDAVKRESRVLPSLFVAMAGVGEQTGMLPEVFTELEKYYVRQRQLRARFIAQAAWPIFQFLAAIFVIAGVIFILGVIPHETGPGALHFDPFVLSGPEGSMIFLGSVFGVVALFAGLYIAATRLLGGRAAVAAFLLRTLVLGPCLRALAMTRFCLALRLTLETGMPITRALRLSFRATDNAAFLARQDKATAAVKEGSELTTALAATEMFTEEFRRILSVAEESGRLTEVLRQEADHYHEEAGRRLTVVTTALTVLVWLMVAGFIITAIFLVAFAYLGLIDQLLG